MKIRKFYENYQDEIELVRAYLSLPVFVYCVVKFDYWGAYLLVG